MSSHRRRRHDRSRVREWTPDHYWPADQGWPDDPDRDHEDGDDHAEWPHDTRKSAVITFVVAALFVAGLGGYGAVRQHHAAVAALGAAATSRCAQLTGAAAARCRSSAPGVTDGSGRPAPGASGAATLPAASAPASGPASSTPAPARSTPAATTPSASAEPTSAPAPSPTPSASAPQVTSSSAAAQVLALINQARAQAGLPDLAISFGLDTSALGHTMVMGAGCGLSHQCPGEPALGARETAAGVTWTSAGENIGEGGPVSDTTSGIAAMAVGLTQAMLNEKPPDDGHRLNILSTSFHHIGIYVLRDANGTLWMTQDFSS